MPRTARLDAPGVLHHVMIRGILHNGCNLYYRVLKRGPMKCPKCQFENPEGMELNSKRLAQNAILQIRPDLSFVANAATT